MDYIHRLLRRSGPRDPLPSGDRRERDTPLEGASSESKWDQCPSSREASLAAQTCHCSISTIPHPLHRADCCNLHRIPNLGVQRGLLFLLERTIHPWPNLRLRSGQFPLHVRQRIRWNHHLRSCYSTVCHVTEKGTCPSSSTG